MQSSETFRVVDACSPSDEELVAQVQGDPRHPAMSILARRYVNPLERVLGWWAWRADFQTQERVDAQELALPVLGEAVMNYHPPAVGDGPVCGFRTFLNRVLRARFLNFARRLRRYKRRLSQEVQAGPALDAQVRRDQADRWRASGVRPTCDPAEVVPRQELLILIEGMSSKLAGPERELWCCFREGHSVSRLAAEFGVAWKTARCRLERLRAKLRRQAKGWC